ncbi:MAG TPA: CBS domain-containing protein [Nakamurella sp.]|nr:CBS domain-containing protein [Nakamurella sp.]
MTESGSPTTQPGTTTDAPQHTGVGDEIASRARERYLAAVAEPPAAAPSTGQPLTSRVPQASPQRSAPPSAPWRTTPVSGVMTSQVITVDENAPFKQIAGTLTANRVSAVPVVDESGRVVGVVSESDLLAKVAAGGEPEAKIGGRYTERRHLQRKAGGETAGDLMSAPAVTVSAHTPVVEAARLAARAHVRRLPVIDAQGKIIGIVTRSDLLQVFLNRDEELQSYLTDVVLARQFVLDPTSVTVDVADGIVTLRGRLESKLVLEPLLTAIRGVTGVVAVHNELSYDPEYYPPPPPLPTYPFA